MSDPAKKLRPVPTEPSPARKDDVAVKTARPTKRHFWLIFSFLALVVIPSAVTGWYLWTRAQDQFASQLGFTVRREETSSAAELIGGLAGFSSSGSSDSDILYEFIRSQELVRRIDETDNLRAIYSAHHGRDPVFAFEPDGTIEDLVNYWRRAVRISYDSGTGLMEVRVLAFDPDAAHRLATAILRECSKMINGLSAIAQADATRYAKEDLEEAVSRLKTAREAITEFRSRTQIVDPSTILQGQIGILNTLQAQLAGTVVEMDLLRESTRSDDPRVRQIERKVAVIEARIASERAKFSRKESPDGTSDYATLVSEFERLMVDREFAEESYAAARSNLGAAQAEAQRQSRYLAAFIQPTRAERAEYPQRITILALVALFAAMAWAILSLIYYALRDRK